MSKSASGYNDRVMKNPHVRLLILLIRLKLIERNWGSSIAYSCFNEAERKRGYADR